MSIADSQYSVTTKINHLTSVEDSVSILCSQVFGPCARTTNVQHVVGKSSLANKGPRRAPTTCEMPQVVACLCLPSRASCPCKQMFNKNYEKSVISEQDAVEPRCWIWFFTVPPETPSSMARAPGLPICVHKRFQRSIKLISDL